jgi:hypothetical protein
MDVPERKADAEPISGPDFGSTVEKALHHDEGLRGSLETGQAVIGADEKKLVRKLDTYLIPLVMALYLFSFLDR